MLTVNTFYTCSGLKQTGSPVENSEANVDYGQQNFSSEEIRLISRNGGIVILRGGHQYYIKRRTKIGTIYMRCAKLKTEKCHGSITTTNNYEILKEQNHSCIPDFAANEIAIKIDACKRRTTATTVPVSAIFHETFEKIQPGGMDPVTQARLFKSVKSSLYRVRRQK